MSRNTLITGAKQVDAGEAVPAGRIRSPGGGRKKNIDKDLELLLELDDLVSPEA